MAKPEDGNPAQYHRLMKEALLELESLQSQLEALRRAQSEPIAIVGLGCRFPAGANSPSEFWNLLQHGVDAVTEIPADRWDIHAYYDPDLEAPGRVYCRNAALVDQSMVDSFSPEFFGIAPREAQCMDPQQRMLLEVCWEALEDAAIPGDRVRGTRTGLFVGSCTDDYLQLFNNLADPAGIEGYSSLGTARCITVGRVSYLLGLEGPAIQLDTACSSSLVAIHQAASSLRSGECDLALAGGVNLQLSPAWTIGLCKLKALAPDGRCKTFDAAANGFGRGEGCGILMLKRLSDALQAGDPIRALLRGTAINHDGRSAGLTVPSQLAQERLLRQALQAANVQPDEIDYIEAHGTGTSLGDPIEMGALASVFPKRTQPLWVGSVKTNIGHLEAAAGIAGLIKVLLAMENETIPPHLHFQRPNPHIPWDDFPVRIPVQSTPWPRGQRPRLAGISSFGFSGTNAHVILQEAPVRQEAPKPQQPCQLLVLSAKTPEALQKVARRYVDRLEHDSSLPWSDVCFTAAAGRAHFAHRLAVLAETGQQACQRLRAHLDCQPTESVWSGEARPADGGHTVWPQRTDLDLAHWPTLIAQAADRYVRGLPVSWESLYQPAGARKIPLPTYPFERQRCWIQRVSSPSTVRSMVGGRGAGAEGSVRKAGPSATSDRTDLNATVGHPLLGRRVYTAAVPQSVLFESRVAAADPAYLADHCLGETVIVPATALLEIALAAGDGFALEDISLQRALSLPPNVARIIQILLTPEQADYRFEIFSRSAATDNPQTPEWIRHASGKIVSPNVSRSPASIDQLRQLCAEEIPSQDVYDRIARQGLRYGPSFRLLRQVWRGTGQALGLVVPPEYVPTNTDSYRFHPAVLDACLHVIAGMRETDSPHTMVPVRVERWEVLDRPGPCVWSHAALRTVDGSGFTFDVDLFDPEGVRVARLTGLRMQSVEPSTLVARPEGEPHSQPIASDLRRPQAPWRQRLEESPPGNQLRLLVNLLRAEVAAVLGWDTPDRVGAKLNLFDLGMDSLTSLELQVRLQKNLGCSLPLSLAFDYPNVQALAGYILGQFGAGTAAPSEGHRDDLNDDAQRLAEMSDQEVQSLLREKYQHLLENAPEHEGTGSG